MPDQAIPAATVILLRDGENGVETLMLRRNSALAFGGMWVFPGGRIDEVDVPEGGTIRSVDAARRAAAREAAEEADLIVSADDMVLFSQWTPPPEAPKRFTTWFFVAAAPEGAVTVDGGEIHEHEWVAPAEVLRRRDAGEVELAPPTWISLHRLAAHATVADALEEARMADVEHFITRVAVADGIRATLWHGDAGYEDGDVDRPGGRHRLLMAEDGWRYDRSS